MNLRNEPVTTGTARARMVEGPGPGPYWERRGYFGVEGLDDLIPGGITYDTQIMVEGDTGIGKSVLAAQFIYEGLLVGDTCIYVACDEPPSLMRQNMASLRLGTVAHERMDKLIFVDAYARERSVEPYKIADPTNFDEFFLYIKKLIDERPGEALRLVIDSISTIMVTADPVDIIEFNSIRLRYLRDRGIFSLESIVRGIMDERTMVGLRHAYPLIVNLTYTAVDGGVQRYIQLGKLKSGMFSAAAQLFTIDPRTGIVVQRRG